MRNILAQLVEKYPNDNDLGVKVRSLVLQFGKEADEVFDIRQKKLECVKKQEYEKAADLRGKEKAILDKIKTFLGL